ncbi:MAG: BLUF domain-containing protein, partial [Pseudomonadota bacterium]
MKCVIYTSNALQDFDSETLRKLAMDAARQNASNDITGYLFYESNKFFQYIEGNVKDIDNLTFRLRGDERHRIIQHYSEIRQEERRFPHWSMLLNPSNTTDYHHIEKLLISHLLILHERYIDIKKWSCNVWQEMDKLALFHRIHTVTPRYGEFMISTN